MEAWAALKSAAPRPFLPLVDPQALSSATQPHDDEARPVTESMYVPGPDQREHPRYEVTFAITLLGENNFYFGLSQNISEGGIFIATHRLLPIGTPVLMSFTLPRTMQTLTVEGTVQWTREPSAVFDDADPDTWLSAVKPGMGIRFRHLDPEAIEAVREFTRWRSPEFYD